MGMVLVRKEALRAEKIDNVLRQMKKQLAKMESLRRELTPAAVPQASPSEARRLIEDIFVPELDVIPDKKEKPGNRDDAV